MGISDEIKRWQLIKYQPFTLARGQITIIIFQVNKYQTRRKTAYLFLLQEEIQQSKGI